MTKVKIQQLECKQCGWKWAPRKSPVMLCPNPKCHSPYWNTPKEEEKDNV